MVTILLERRKFIRATHFTSADLCGRIDNRRRFTSVDSSIDKGQSDCEIPAAKIWPPTRTPVRDCIRPYFSERPT